MPFFKTINIETTSMEKVELNFHDGGWVQMWIEEQDGARCYTHLSHDDAKKLCIALSAFLLENH